MGGYMLHIGKNVTYQLHNTLCSIWRTARCRHPSAIFHSDSSNDQFQFRYQNINSDCTVSAIPIALLLHMVAILP